MITRDEATKNLIALLKLQRLGTYSEGHFRASVTAQWEITERLFSIDPIESATRILDKLERNAIQHLDFLRIGVARIKEEMER